MLMIDLKNIHYYLLILAIPLILIGAWLDTIFLSIHSFKQYVYICVWEYSILWFGVLIGVIWTKTIR